MNWIARGFVSAVVRRIAVALVVVLLSCVGISGKAHAGLDGTACGSNESTLYPGCDQGTALADCQTQLAALKAKNPTANVTYPCNLSSGDANGGAYRCEVRDSLGPKWCGPTGGAPFYNFSGACTARASYFQGVDNDLNIAKVCSAGCEYKMKASKKGDIFSPRRDKTSWSSGMMEPSGGTCSTATTPPRKPPPGQACHETEGGHKVCKRDDGKTCVTSAATGRTYCAADGEPTNATNPNRTENVTIGPAGPLGNPPPATPPTPRPGEDWKPSASATVNNNSTSNSNSSSITINGNAGTPNGNPDNANPGDGSGNPGTPGSSGGGNTDGEGAEQSGAAGAGVGDLYSKDPMTPTQALGAYTAAVLDTPIANAIQAFFGDCAYSGTCPTWSYDGGEMMGALTFDALCSGAFADLIAYAGYIVLSMAAFAAFRIAIY